MILLLIACQIHPPVDKLQDSTSQEVLAQDTSDSSTDTDTQPPLTSSGRTVLLLTIDTLNRDFVHASLNGEPITPELDRLFEESAYFPNTLVTRGQTSPSLASILTGLYPRTTMVRSNPRVLEAEYATLPERYQNAGFTTIGFSANFCHYIGSGIDIRRCVHPDEEPDLEQGLADKILVDELLTTLEQQPSNEDLFIWLHLMDPHDPYRLTEPYFSEFHPDNYSGPLQTETDINLNALNNVTFGQSTLTNEDMAFFNAVYASQVRQTDEHIKRVLDMLRGLNRYADSIIVFGSDHGEALGSHNGYFYHGCSAFNSVAGVHWSFKAPDVIANQYPGWISTTDIAPTLVSLSGLDWSGRVEGQDLAVGLRDGSPQYKPVFVERGTETAGVIFQQIKYILSTVDEFKQCTPYNQVPYGFASPREQIFDLASDYEEQNNLFQVAPSLRAQGQSILCNWITEAVWTTASNDPTHPMVQRCATILEQLQGSE